MAAPIESSTSSGFFDKLPTANDFVNYGNITFNVLQQWFVAPLARIGLAGFELSIEETQTMSLRSDVTDHYTELGNTINDHVALQPTVYSFSGKIGEKVNNYGKSGKSGFKQFTEQAITVISYLPVLTSTISSVQSRFANAGSSFGGLASAILGGGLDIYEAYKIVNPPDTEQAKAFNFFRAMWLSKQPFSVETPWAFYNNMVITEMDFEQPADSKLYTNFSGKVKQIRTITTQTAEVDPSRFKNGKASNQITPVSKNGKVGGKNVPESTLYKGVGAVF